MKWTRLFSTRLQRARMVVVLRATIHHREASPMAQAISVLGIDIAKPVWKGFEQWLIRQFPQAKTLATPFNDPIAKSIDEYQSFLKSLGYSPISKAAFGKKVR
jgi:hypothetical protein